MLARFINILQVEEIRLEYLVNLHYTKLNLTVLEVGLLGQDLSSQKNTFTKGKSVVNVTFTKS